MPLKIAATGCGNRVCSEELCRVLIPPVNHDCCSDAALTSVTEWRNLAATAAAAAVRGDYQSVARDASSPGYYIGLYIEN